MLIGQGDLSWLMGVQCKVGTQSQSHGRDLRGIWHLCWKNSFYSQCRFVFNHSAFILAQHSWEFMCIIEQKKKKVNFHLPYFCWGKLQLVLVKFKMKDPIQLMDHVIPFLLGLTKDLLLLEKIILNVKVSYFHMK